MQAPLAVDISIALILWGAVDWILVVNSVDLGYERGTSERLHEILAQLPREATVLKALQFAAALGTDAANRYRTVDELLLRGAPQDLTVRIAALRARSDLNFVFFEPWQQLLIARHASRHGSIDPAAVELHTDQGRTLFLEACRVVNDLSMPPAPPLTGEPITDAQEPYQVSEDGRATSDSGRGRELRRRRWFFGFRTENANHGQSADGYPMLVCGSV